MKYQCIKIFIIENNVIYNVGDYISGDFRQVDNFSEEIFYVDRDSVYPMPKLIRLGKTVLDEHFISYVTIRKEKIKQLLKCY